MDFATGAAQKT